MNLTGIVPILNVSDVPASLQWFEKLGWKTRFAWNDGGMMEVGTTTNDAGPANFAAVGVGDHEIFLCRDGQGARSGPITGSTQNEQTGGVWMSLFVSSPAEVNTLYALAQREGMTVGVPPFDAPWGVREFHLCHPDGHVFRVGAGLDCD